MSDDPIKTNVQREGDKVKLTFDRSITWLTMPPGPALWISNILRLHAENILNGIVPDETPKKAGVVIPLRLVPDPPPDEPEPEPQPGLGMCEKCKEREALHMQADGDESSQFCCQCHVAAGNPPSDYHEECVKAAKGQSTAEQKET